jgi:hypothetical protein
MKPQQSQRPHDEVIAVFGHRGSGKTTWLIKNIDNYQPFVLVDPLYDPKFKTLNLYAIKSPDEALQLFQRGQPRRVYISPNLETFDFFCGLILAKGDMTLIVDEVDNYATSYFISSYFKKILKIGRHRNVSLITVSRRPKEMNPLIRSQAKRFIVFPLGGEDLKALESYLSKTIIHCASNLKSTNEYSEYIDYNFQTREYTLEKIMYIDNAPI